MARKGGRRKGTKFYTEDQTELEQVFLREYEKLKKDKMKHFNAWPSMLDVFRLSKKILDENKD